MKTSEILNKAADLIETRGWVQGNMQGTGAHDPWGGGAASDAPVCLEGGIMAAMGLSTDNFGLPPSGFRDCPAYKAVRSYLPDDPFFLFDFNDTPGRTAEEVIEVLRAAAVIEQAKESEPAKAGVSA